MPSLDMHSEACQRVNGALSVFSLGESAYRHAVLSRTCIACRPRINHPYASVAAWMAHGATSNNP